MVKISSNSVVAEGAIRELTGIDSSNMSNETINITYSTVSSMVSGNALNSKLMNELSNLVQVVLVQANKFPEIAHRFEEQDMKTEELFNGQ